MTNIPATANPRSASTNDSRFTVCSDSNEDACPLDLSYREPLSTSTHKGEHRSTSAG
jgi:hypothetical protein